ncbi:Methylsterol monooxygenase 2-1 [Abeliophyllum distichum]|uniref:Methylsterol monooxygenase 2-1 n=1 Tax=Abeliophyllum distichum TaxID=126358 RepID=A0ABD1Q857_9LAMI
MSSITWGCEVVFPCRPGIFRKVVSTQILFYFILEDFIFYWGHRILHTKWLYKHVHSVHHEYATPFGLTSEYAHPAEILFLGFATIVGPAITGPHLITLWLWMVLRVLETVEAHSRISARTSIYLNLMISARTISARLNAKRFQQSDDFSKDFCRN